MDPTSNNSSSRSSHDGPRYTNPIRSPTPQQQAQKHHKNSTSPSGLSVATFPARPASIDDTPAASTASSSPNSPFSSTQNPWSPDPALQNASSSSTSAHPSLISPFAHPLDSTKPYATNQSNHPSPLHRSGSFQRPLPGRFESGIPMTPGEEKMVFDKGLLFSSHHRPSTRSDPTNEVFSEPLPKLPSMVVDRAGSDPEAATITTAGERYTGELISNSHHQSSNTDISEREIRSTPIHMPVIHHPSPTTTTTSIYSSSQQSFAPRTPSPNLSTLIAQQPHSALTSTSSLHRSLGDSNNNIANSNSIPYSAPSSLRPDSIVSFPDSSPLMAPNVLAAVDARLRESNRQKVLASSQPSASSLAHPVHPHQQHSGTSQGSSSNSNAASSSSSAAPVSEATSPSVSPSVITHHDVLQSSELILSREQLFDALNGDDDDDEEDDEQLTHPKPGFARNQQRRGASSSRSSLPRSSASSYRSGSGIELNTKVQKPVSAKLAASGIESGRGNNGKEREWISAAMVTKGGADSKERYSTLDSTAELPSTYPQTSNWLESKRRTSRRWRRTCFAVGLLVFVGIIAGIAIGFVSRKNKIDGLAPPTSIDPEKPTTVPVITQFPPNPNLHKSFYGLDYNPAKTIMPWCGAGIQDVINDINVISQLTNRVRLYGMDCGQADLTFQAINLLNLNMTMKVVLTVWVDNNATTYQRQYDTLFRVLDTYGTNMVQGISVGNEAIFRGDITLTDLGTRMATVKSEIKKRYNANIPIFTSEIGNNLNSTLADLSDELSGNLHPFFAGVAVETAAQWTFSQYNITIEDNPTPSKLKGTISEVGWPSAPASAVNKPSAVPGVANLQTMVDTFICQANAAKMPYYWFEYKDEPWKNDPTVPVEPNWGLFDKSGNLKVRIPDCPAP
ncbi:hypothetical protein BGZ47_002793 [Haplosporangium gracile]|nr:hypothetical protein BGZ47_002793 [Haplosporangium gracile]